MKLKDLLERLDHEIELEVLVTNGFDIVADCTERNEIRAYENNEVLEISTDDHGAMIVTVEK
jgi:hypothetical protein